MFPIPTYATHPSIRCICALSAVAGLALFASCQWETEKPTTTHRSLAELHLEFRATSATRTRQVLYDVRNCDGRRVHQSRAVLSTEQPGSAPLDLMGERFLTVSPGCFTLRATPLGLDGHRSHDCPEVREEALEVTEGEDLHVLLASRCGTGGHAGGSDAGLDAGLDAGWDEDAERLTDTTTVPPADVGEDAGDTGETREDTTPPFSNEPPELRSLTFDPGKFVPCDTDVKVCAVANDPDGDRLRFDWNRLSGPLLSSAPQTVSRHRLGGFQKECVRMTPGAGSWTFEVVVHDQRRSNGAWVDWEEYYDEHGVTADSYDSLEFPLYGEYCDDEADAGGVPGR